MAAHMHAYISEAHERLMNPAKTMSTLSSSEEPISQVYAESFSFEHFRGCDTCSHPVFTISSRDYIAVAINAHVCVCVCVCVIILRKLVIRLGHLGT